MLGYFEFRIRIGIGANGVTLGGFGSQAHQLIDTILVLPLVHISSGLLPNSVIQMR
jgi:hypothetical protein